MQPQKRKTHFYCVPFSTGAKHFIAVVRELKIIGDGILKKISYDLKSVLV